MTEDERQRIVAAGLAKFAKPEPEPEDVRILRRAMDASRRIRDKHLPAVQAHGFVDRKEHGLAIGTDFLEEFYQWPKEDLVFLCATIHTDFLIEKIR